MPDLVTNGDSDIISHTNMNMTLHQEKFSHKSTSVSGESIIPTLYCGIWKLGIFASRRVVFCNFIFKKNMKAFRQFCLVSLGNTHY